MRFFLDGLQQKRSLEARLLQSMQDLQATEAIAEEEKGRLLSLQEERRQLLVATNAELDTKHDALQQLERDRVALQKVIEQIERQRSLAQAVEKEREEKQGQKTLAQAPLVEAQHVNKPDAAASQPSSLYSAEDLARLQTTAFKKRKGALPWPVNGSIAHRFGEQRQGNVSWDGLRIRAAAGVDVRAVHYGRVVYADWLRGQGMLVILDHGDGFMSLYAHNDVLLRSQVNGCKRVM